MSKIQKYSNQDIQITNPLYEQIDSKKTIMRNNEDGNTVIFFYKCVYRNIEYKYIIWNLNKNTLTFYTNEENEQIFRHDVCIDFKIQDCFQEYNKIPQTEINFYISETKKLVHNIKNNIQDFEILEFPDIEHYITLFSEKDNYGNVLYNMCKCFLKFTGKKIRLDVFIKHNLMRDVMIKRYKNNPFIRIHQIDNNLLQELENIDMLYTYMHENIKNFDNDEYVMKNIYSIITRNIVPLLCNTFVNNQHIVYKMGNQIKKMNNMFYFEVYDKFRYNACEYFIEYKDTIDKKSFLYSNFNESDLGYIKRFHNLILKDGFLNDIKLFLFDMYIISKMFEQNNTFCIYYSDTVSYNNIQQLLKKYENKK